MKLQDRVALVTGAGTGIGRGIAEAFARQGVKVAVNYSRSRDAAEEVVRDIRSTGGTAIAIGASVANDQEVRGMVDQIAREFGKLDILVNNAGWSTRIPHDRLEDLTDEVWNRTFDTNLRGAFYCVRAAVPLMRQQEGSAIVNIASVAGMTGLGSSMAYAASKGAMITHDQIAGARAGARNSSECDRSGIRSHALRGLALIGLRRRRGDDAAEALGHG